MINVDRKDYDYFLLGVKNAYGQQTLPGKDAIPNGKINMAIYTTSQAIQDNILYKDSQYIGLTNNDINDTYIIQYGDKRLKVLYVLPIKKRYTQVFLTTL